MIRNAHFDEGINLACVLDFKCANVNLKLSYLTLSLLFFASCVTLQIGRNKIIKKAAQKKVQTHFNPKKALALPATSFPLLMHCLVSCSFLTIAKTSGFRYSYKGPWPRRLRLLAKLELRYFSYQSPTTVLDVVQLFDYGFLDTGGRLGHPN